MVNVNTSSFDNVSSTTLSPESLSIELPLEAGYLFCISAVVLFGSAYIPVKKYETGDGIFFQWVFSIAMWLSGLALHAIRGFPRFWPGAMLGGVFYAAANVMSVPIIHRIGMGMGLLTWSMTDLLTGWAAGRFGWFGIQAEVPKLVNYNYIGVALCSFGAIMTGFIQPNIKREDSQVELETLPLSSRDEECQHLLAASSSGSYDSSTSSTSNYSSITSHDTACIIDQTKYLGEPKSPTLQQRFARVFPKWGPKIIGITMAIIAGSLDGLIYVPLTYIKENFPVKYGYDKCTKIPCITDVSSQDMDYIFAQYSGVLLSSTFIFIVYCIVTKNKPQIYPESILPSFISGLIWGVGMISFFIANEVLSEAISFPIVNAGAGFVATLWGVMWFREIEGKRNLAFLVCGFCFIVSGCTFVILSNI